MPQSAEAGIGPGSLEVDTATVAFSWKLLRGHPCRPQGVSLRCSGVPAGMPTAVGCFREPETRASKAHTNRRKSWGLWDKGSPLVKPATSLAGACLGAPSPGKAAKAVQRQTRCCTDPLPEKGPAAAWSGSRDNVPEGWGHAASTPLLVTLSESPSLLCAFEPAVL